MKRVSFLTTALLTLVAFTGLSATAFAVIADPGCPEQDTRPAILDFQLNTTDSDKAHAVSGVKGSGYACGSYLTGGFGDVQPDESDATLMNHADIEVPPGVVMTDTGSVPDATYAGMADVNILLRHPQFGPAFMPDVRSVIRTDDKAECIRERAEEVVGDTPQGEIVACLHGANALGENWNWATERQVGDGKKLSASTPTRYTLTIGPMHAPTVEHPQHIDPGLTYIDMQLCGYFGDTGTPVESGECGAKGAQFFLKNGDASMPYSKYQRRMPNCKRTTSSNRSNGIYAITATREDQRRTNRATCFVDWYPPFGSLPKRPLSALSR